MHLSAKKYKSLSYKVFVDKNTVSDYMAKGYTLVYAVGFVGKSFTYSLKKKITF